MLAIWACRSADVITSPIGFKFISYIAVLPSFQCYQRLYWESGRRCGCTCLARPAMAYTQLYSTAKARLAEGCMSLKLSLDQEGIRVFENEVYSLKSLIATENIEWLCVPNSVHYSKCDCNTLFEGSILLSLYLTPNQCAGIISNIEDKRYNALVNVVLHTGAKLKFYIGGGQDIGEAVRHVLSRRRLNLTVAKIPQINSIFGSTRSLNFKG